MTHINILSDCLILSTLCFVSYNHVSIYMSFRLSIHSYNILNTIQLSIYQPFRSIANKHFKDWELVKFYDGIRIYELKTPSFTEECSSKGLINFMGKGMIHIVIITIIHVLSFILFLINIIIM